MQACNVETTNKIAEDKLQRLAGIGFLSVGQCTLEGDALVIKLHDSARSRNVLYAFVVNKQPLYIGKTIRSLGDRMAGYRSPGSSNSTNIKNNQYIHTALTQGKEVLVYCLPDNGLLYYGGFHLNLAAGLEDSLIRDLTPSWNTGKKEVKDGVMETTEAN